MQSQQDLAISLIYEQDYVEWLEITLNQLENRNLENIDWEHLQQLLIKPATRRVAGRSPAIGFIFLFVAGLKANCCN